MANQSGERARDRRQVEVVAPHRDPVIDDLEDPHHRQGDLAAVLAPHHVGALIHHQRAATDLLMNVKVDAIEYGEKLGNEVLDRIAASDWIHRNIVVHSVFSELTSDPVGVGRRPKLGERND